MQSLSNTLRNWKLAAPEPLPDEAQCPRCGGFDLAHAGVRRVLEARGLSLAENNIVGCKCQKREEERLAREAIRWQEANLPHGASPRTFDNFEPIPGSEGALEACRTYDGHPPLLTLLGISGCGKSHLLEALGRQMLARGATVRFEFVPALIDRLRHTHTQDSEEDVRDLMEWYNRVGVLLLDDIGAERVTPFGVEKLTELLEYRFTTGKRIVVSTNYPYTELEKRVGPRLAGRVLQSNPRLHDGRVVVMTNGSWRM